MTNGTPRTIEKSSSLRSHIKYTIVRKNYENNFYPDLPAYYGNVSQELYLNLLENKAKVLKDKVNVEYVAAPHSLDYTPNGAPITITSKSITKREFVDEDDDDACSYTDEAPHGYYHEAKRIRTLQHSSRLDELQNPTNPPSLAQLRQKDVDTENKINDQKREILAKINMMKMIYPNLQCQYMNMCTDLDFMRNEYNEQMLKLHVRDKTAQYKKIMAVLFYFIEWALGKGAKMNVAGYAKFQINNLSQYDRLLFELSNKRYMPDAPERYPVELRILGMVVINTAIFIVMQKVTTSISGSSFADLTNILSSVMSNTPMDFSQSNDHNQTTSTQQSTPSANIQQPKMQGPKIYVPPKPTIVLNKQDEATN